MGRKKWVQDRTNNSSLPENSRAVEGGWWYMARTIFKVAEIVSIYLNPKNKSYI